MKVFLCLIVIFAFSLSQSSASKKSYVVYLGGHSHGKEATLSDYQQATASHHEFLASFVGSMEEAKNAMFYSYTKTINGFAAFLDDQQVERISSDPRVVSVIPNVAFQLHTTRSWELMDLERNGRVPNSSIWAKANFGKDTIIASFDTGVWPESESFNDKGIGPIPSIWKGTCNSKTNGGVSCNRKLIGARYFDIGSSAATGRKPADKTVRDHEGHGTHTLSTAAGRPVADASFFGYAKGTAQGGSPAARAAMYKVCWDLGCFSADILAGFDEAIHDGVDVISISLGGYAEDYVTDPIAVGSFHAVAQGITVVCSAGNAGPTEGSLSNVAPWIITVGASTLDREFPTYATLGNNKKLKGQSLSSKSLPANKFYPLVSSVNAKAAHADKYDAEMCIMGSLDPTKVRGKIVACLRGYMTKMEKGEAVMKAGGAGMIVANDDSTGNITDADPQLLPATNIGYKDGVALWSYINSTKSPEAYISLPATTFDVKPAPKMAYFSSRGPSQISPEIIKPDITAPGVSILAAFTNYTSPTSFDYDKRRVAFNLLSGTSMSCPHVSGVAGLLRTLYPDWSPAAIRSAIMTTARTQDNTGQSIRDEENIKATPFAYGSGHIRPNRAADPGLIYDLTVNDYLDFLCASGYNSTAMKIFNNKAYKCPSVPMKLEDLNYPSIAAPNLNGSFTVTRTVKNVGRPGTYKIRIEEPRDISVSVKPMILTFNKVGEEKTFTVTLKSKGNSTGAGFAFGKIIWSDGKHYVRSPLAVNVV